MLDYFESPITGSDGNHGFFTRGIAQASNKPSRAAADEFRDYCLELLSARAARWRGMVSRRAACLAAPVLDGWQDLRRSFAFDQLWLKADEQSRGAFEDRRLWHLHLRSGWQDAHDGYYTVPPDAMESAA